MFKRFTKKSEAHTEVTHASVAADALQRALNTTQVVYDLPMVNIIQLALEQLKHALAIGEGVLGSDELSLATTYIKAMEKLQHDVETKTNKLERRSSVGDLLLGEETPAPTVEGMFQAQRKGSKTTRQLSTVDTRDIIPACLEQCPPCNSAIYHVTSKEGTRNETSVQLPVSW